jgi:hypothetical protein
MPVETVYKSLDGWFVQMTNIARRLPGFLTSHHGSRIDRSECINDDFSSDRLDGVDNDCYRSRVELFERLLISPILRGHIGI